jgi:hypothetical protein
MVNAESLISGNPKERFGGASVEPREAQRCLRSGSHPHYEHKWQTALTIDGTRLSTLLQQKLFPCNHALTWLRQAKP